MRLPRSPAQLMPELYAALWRSGAVADMKALSDACLSVEPREVEAAFEVETPQSSEDIRQFVDRWFTTPATPHQLGPCDPMPLADRIDYLWDFLLRPPGYQQGLSQVQLNHAHIVPGGAFRECYYWDSYFTLVGLDDHRASLRHECVAALAEQIERFGYVPNGTRTYYLSRSQPPTFFASVAALSPDAPEEAWAQYLPHLVREHEYWMRGAENLEPGRATNCVLRLRDGAYLNRYWDDLATPRDEARAGRDVQIAAAALPRSAEEVFRDIRAGCASGWDFSSRWFGDRVTMRTIKTTAIAPVDLNALLFGLETAIARGAGVAGDRQLRREFDKRAHGRRDAIEAWMWNAALGVYDDFDFVEGTLRGAVSAAALVPLFAGAASPKRAERMLREAMAQLIAPGGLRATTFRTGEQWDAPNGWAPSHWLAITGLRRYGFIAEAEDLARRWLETVTRVYADTGRLMEKYDVELQAPGSGGGYPLEDGFGWTNGVTAALLREYPSLAHFGAIAPTQSNGSGA